jgi:glycerol-3-phosphate dehydrogenase subunit C
MRVALAERTFDAGEYLRALWQAGGPRPAFGEIRSRALYFPPCHQREQEFGQPYLALLAAVPGLAIEPLTGSLDCCGLAGVMGFKRSFHEASLRLGSRLMDRIRALAPELLVTDCLSCRLQFNQALEAAVRHPLEILAESMRRADAGAAGVTGRLESRSPSRG